MAMVWLITGASSGLGDGIARAVLDRGDFAAVTSRDTSRLKSLAGQYPNQVFPVSLDLNSPASIRQAVKSVQERFGKMDVLVNNAGYGYRAAIEESEPEAVRELFAANFFGPMELTRQLLPQMREQRSGLIISVSSIGAVRSALGNAYYSAAKGALELACEALAKEVQPLGISCDQPGDPIRAGKLLVETALRQDAPFRLLLGSDALHAAVDTLEARLREARGWAEVSSCADFDDLQK